MKKIIFVLQTMVLGGVEKELITVLKQIHSQYDITLLLLYVEDEEILKDIPSDVKIRILNIDKKYYCSSSMTLIKQRLQKGHIVESASILIKRLLRIGQTHANTNIEDIPVLDDMFNIAVCYHIHSPLTFKYVAQKIQAKKKIAWIHSDFYTSGYNIRKLKKYFIAYDEFVAVSRKVENEFRELCPFYQDGASTAYNYLDAHEIVKLSGELIEDDVFLNVNNIKLLTVGRFTEEKGIDFAIEACGMLKRSGIKHNWFLIGYGELEDYYRSLIKKHDVQDCFTILGKRTNPYPYIKACDIYVQPSRHEAFGLVIKEAKILKKPIVCTDFDGADEQIDNDINGIIVPLNDVSALYEALSKLIKSPALRLKFSEELEKWQAEDDLKEIVKHFD